MSEPLTAEQAAEVTRLYFEIFNAHDLDRAPEILTSDYINHSLTGPIEGREAFLALIADMFLGIPDLHWTLIDQRTDGDRIVFHYEVTGTHQGVVMGVPGSGNPLRFTGMEMSRVVDGRLAETWNYVDLMALLGQVGAIRTS
jgi:steroid delta-isomerase-like uncharacterized protein